MEPLEKPVVLKSRWIWPWILFVVVLFTLIGGDILYRVAITTGLVATPEVYNLNIRGIKDLLIMPDGSFWFRSGTRFYHSKENNLTSPSLRSIESSAMR